MEKKNIEKIIQILEKFYEYKKRTTLNRMRKKGKRDAFKILISCLLSLRTRDKNTEKASKNLFSIARTPKQIVSLPIKKIEKLIYSSGYYKNKARTLKHVSKIILEKHKGKVPGTEEELLAIKGIGRKTANIVLGFAFNKLVIPVDVHVHVTANRLGWIKTKTPEQTEKALQKIIQKKYWKEFNGLFVLFGKEICITISPKCSICPVKMYCQRIDVVRSR